MAGLMIDVDTASGTARRDLQELNNNLASIFRSAEKTKGALNTVNGQNLSNLNSNIKETTKNASLLSKTLSTTFAVAIAPLRLIGSLITNIKAQLMLLAATALAIKGVGVFNEMGDALLLIKNRLKLVTKETENLTSVQYALYRVASETRTTFEDTVNIYFNLRKAMEKTTMGTADFERITRTLQKTVTLSNMPLQTTRAALVQLNQGLASGTLRGEELNSVVEQLPALGQLLTKSLNTNIGDLRKFAEQGRLTSEVVFRVLSENSESVAKQFDKLTITAAQGFLRFKESLSLLGGEINAYYGNAERFGNLFTKLAKRVDEFTTLFANRATLAKTKIRESKEEIKNGLAQLKDLSFITKIVWDLGLDKSFEAYTIYRDIEKRIDNIVAFVRKQQLRLDKLFGTSFHPTNFPIESKLVQFKKSLVRATEELTGVKFDNTVLTIFQTQSKVITNTLLIFYSNLEVIYKVITGIFDKFPKLLPDIRGPVKLWGASVVTEIKSAYKKIELGLTDATIPLSRGLDSVYEHMFGFLKGDTSLERDWIKLLRTLNWDALKNRDLSPFLKQLNEIRKNDSFKEFIKQLHVLQGTEREIRFNNLSVLFNDIRMNLRGFAEDLMYPLRAAGILENRLLFINNIRFDRIQSGAQTLAAILKRVYTDILRPKFGHYFYDQLVQMELSVKILNNAIASGNDQALNLGKRLGEFATTRILKFFDSLKNSIKGLSEGDVGGPLQKALKAVTTLLFNLLKLVGSFLKGVFIGIFDGLPVELRKVLTREFEYLKKKFQGIFEIRKPSEVLRDFSKGQQLRELRYSISFKPTNYQEVLHFFDTLTMRFIKAASELSEKAERKIRIFTENVKNYFYDTWDKIVGHSYWPDTIDGIVSYTKNLFKAESKIETFVDKVKSSFKKLPETLKQLKDKAFSIFSKLSISLGKIDIESLGASLREVLGAAFIGALLFAFGGKVGKLLLIDFVSNISGALVVISPAFMKFFGESAAFFGKSVVEALIRALDTVVALLPAFTKGLLDGLGGFGTVIKGLLDFLPDNGLIYALLWGTGIYALKAEKGLATVKELLFGADAKTSKKGTVTQAATPGLISTLLTPFTSKPVADLKAYMSKVSPIKSSSPGWFDLLIFGPTANPKMLLAAVAAFSTSLLNSVSLLEASFFGVPLLATALLGNKAGGKAVSEILFGVLPSLMGSLYKTLENYMLRFKLLSPIGMIMKGSREWSSELGDKVTDNLSKRNAAQTPKSKFQMVTEGVKQAIINAKKNAGDYVAGKISLADMFLNTEINGFKNRSDLPRRIKELWQSVITKSFMGLSLGGSANFLKKSFETILLGLEAYFASGGGFARLKGALAAQFNTLWSTIAAGLSGIMSLLRSRIVAFSVLMGTLFGTAQAASNDKFVDNSLIEKLLYFTKVIAGATAALFALGVGFKAFAAGKAARALAIENIKSAIEVAPETLAAKQKIYRKTLRTVGPKTAGAAGIAGEAAAAGVNYLKYTAVQDFISSGGAENARKAGVNKSLSESLSWIIKIKDGIKNTIFSKDWWSSLGDRPRQFFNDLNISIDNYIKRSPKLNKLSVDLAAAFAIMPEAPVRGIRLATTAFTTFGKSLLSLTTLVGVLRASFVFLWKAISTAIVSLLSFLGVSATIAGLLSAGGLLYVAFFGEGNSFPEKLAWAKDRILELFGMQPKGRVARMIDVVDQIPEMKFNDEFGKQQDKSFKKQLANIDYEVLSQTQQDVLKDSAATVKELFKDLEKQTILFGKASPDTAEKWRNASKELENYIAKLPQLKEVTLRQRIIESEDLLKTNDSTGTLSNLWLRLKNVGKTINESSLSEAISGKIIQNKKETYEQFQARLESRNQRDLEIAGKIPTAESISRIHSPYINKYFKKNENNTSLRSMHEQILRYQNGLDSYQVDGYKDAINDLDTAFGKLYLSQKKLEEQPNNLILQHIVSVNTKKFEQMRDNLIRLGENLLIDAIPISNNKDFQAQLRTTAELVNKTFGVDFGKDGKDFFGSSFDLTELTNIANEIERIKEEYTKFGDNFNFNGSSRRQRINELTARGKNKAEKSMSDINLKGSIEYAVKLSGVTAATEELARAFKFDPQKGTAFVKRASEIGEIAIKIDGITGNLYKKANESEAAYTERVSKGLSDLQVLFESRAVLMKKQAESTIVGPLDLINAKFTELGLQQVGVDQFLHLRSVLDESITQSNKLIKLKDDLAKINPVTQFDLWLSTFKELTLESGQFKRDLEAATQTKANWTAQKLGVPVDKLLGPQANQPKKFDRYVSTAERMEAYEVARASPAGTTVKNFQGKIMGGLVDTKELAKEAAWYQSTKKSLEKEFEDLGDTIFERFSKNVQKGGLSISLEDVFTVDAADRGKLHQSIKDAIKLRLQLDNAGQFFPNNEKAFEATFNQWQKLKTEQDKLIEKAKENSIGGMFDKITKGGFEGAFQDAVNLTDTALEGFLKIGVALADLDKKIADVFALKGLSPERRLEALKTAIGEFATLSEEQRKAQETNASSTRRFELVSGKGDIDLDTWIRSSRTTQDNLYQAALNVAAIERDLTKSTHPSEKIKLEFEAARKAMEDASLNARELAVSPITFKTEQAVKAGLQLDGNLYSSLKDSPKALIDNAAKQINDIQRRILVENLTETEEKILRERVVHLQAAANQFLEKQSEIYRKMYMLPEETQAYQAALSFGDSVVSSFSSGLKDALQGKTSLKEFGKAFIDSVTSTVIDTFTEGLMSSFKGEDGLINGWLKKIGIDLFQLGSGIFGNGEKKIDSNTVFKNATDKFASAVDKMIGKPSEKTREVDDLTKNKIGSEELDPLGNDINKWSAATDSYVTDDWTKNGPNLTKLEDTTKGFLEKFTETLGNKFTSLLDSLKNFDFNSILGSLSSIGTSILSFFGFASGGKVSGPGTGTSDSIPAMLSNGEFVVNAASTRKYAGLLSAINSGSSVAHFAEGGPVGAVAASVSEGSVAAISSLTSSVSKLAQNQETLWGGVTTVADGVSTLAGATEDSLKEGFKAVDFNLNKVQENTQLGLNAVARSAIGDGGSTDWFGIILSAASMAIGAYNAFQPGGFLSNLGNSLSNLSSTGTALGSAINQSWANAAMQYAPGLKLATGGFISGPGTGTSDSIAAMLSNGEFVVNAAATKRFAPLLEAINSNRIGRHAEGGLIGNMSVSDSSLVLAGEAPKANSSVFNINITGDISRQTKREIYSMMPHIANGVNMHNKETRYRG